MFQSPEGGLGKTHGACYATSATHSEISNVVKGPEIVKTLRRKLAVAKEDSCKRSKMAKINLPGDLGKRTSELRAMKVRIHRAKKTLTPHLEDTTDELFEWENPAQFNNDWLDDITQYQSQYLAPKTITSPDTRD